MDGRVLITLSGLQKADMAGRRVLRSHSVPGTERLPGIAGFGKSPLTLVYVSQRVRLVAHQVLRYFRSLEV